MGLADLLAEGKAAHIRQHHVEDRQLQLHLVDVRQGAVGIITGIDLVAVILQVQCDQVRDLLLVIDDEDFIRHSLSPSGKWEWFGIPQL